MTAQRQSNSTLLLGLCCLVAVVGLIFLPLGLSAAEHFTVGSSHVEDFCRRIGLHDALDPIYTPVLRLFQ